MARECECTKNADDDMSIDEHLTYAVHKAPSLDSFLDALFRVIRRETDFYRRYDRKSAQEAMAKYIYKYSELCVCGDKPKPEVVVATQADCKHCSKTSNCAKNKKKSTSSSGQRTSALSSSKVDESASRTTIAAKVNVTAKANETPIDNNRNGNGNDDDDLVAVRVNNDYNGATCQKYSWSQAINEIDVIVPIASSVASSRHVRVFIRSDDLTVLANVAGNWVQKINGRLCHSVRPMNSMWTLHPSSHIHISLEKERERWWNALIDGEEQLGVGSKDRSVKFDHLTEDEQATVQKLAFEQYLKRKQRANGDH